MNIYEKLFELFHARQELYATCFYDKRSKRYRYKSVKRKYTPKILEQHCTDVDSAGIGVYPIINEDQTQWVAADFDIHDDAEKKEFSEALERIYGVADGIECNVYREMSKSGQGTHLWIFFREPITAWKARKMMMAILEAANATHLSSMDRLFPSQDRVYQEGKRWGNLIHLPFSAQFIDKGTYFIDRDGEKYGNDPDDIEAWLDTVIQHSPEYVETILDKWGLTQEVDQALQFETDDLEYEYSEDGLEQVLQDPFISWCREHPKDVDYNAWIAMISNLLPYGDPGVLAIHQISQLDPTRYRKSDAQRKIIGMTGVKPITYNWIVKNTNYNERPDVGYKSPAAAGVKTNRVYTSIYENWGRYYKKTKGDDVELSNFLMIPTKLVSIDEKIQRIFDFKSQTAVIKDVPVTGEQLAGANEFRKLTMDIAHNTLFYGSGFDLLKVIDYLNQSYPNVPRVTGKAAVGLHWCDTTQTWVVLTQKATWDINGSRDDIIYYNPRQRKEIIYDPKPIIRQTELEAIKEHLFVFNTFAVTASVLAWIFTLPVAERLYQTKGLRFPVMMIHGQAGSGKTETARHIIQRFFGDVRPMFSISDITKFSMEAMGTSSNTFPVLFDEYKPGGLDNWKLRAVSSMIRNLYDHSSGQKGRKDLSTIEFPVTSPLVVCGEQGFEEPALVERSIDVFLAKSDSAEFLDHFLELKKLPLARFGNDYMNWTLQITDSQLHDMYNAELGDRTTDRPTHNMSILKVGLTLMGMYFKSKGLRVSTYKIKEVFEAHQMEHIEVYGSTRSVVDNIMEGIFDMYDLGLIGAELMREESMSKCMTMYIPGIYPQFREWAFKTKFEFEILSKREFVSQLAKMQYYLGTKTVRFEDQNPKKAVRIDLRKLQKAGVISGEGS